MKPSASIKRLAGEMASRRRAGRPPFLLVLGRATGRSASVPGVESIAYQVLNDLLNRADELATSRLSKQDLRDEDKVIHAFHGLLGDVSSGKRYRMLQRFYGDVPVPLSYQNLAVLTKAGYFSTILTTNLHTLLEQALSGAGLLQDRHYQVIDLGADLSSKTSPRLPNMVDCPINIVRLLGNVGQHQANVIPEEVIEYILEPGDSRAEGYYLGDTVIVGYEFERDYIDKWLERTPDSESTKLWWVSPERPNLGHVEEARNVAYVDGPNANPEAFFGQLTMMLLRLPVEAMAAQIEASDEPVEDGAESAPADLSYSGSILAETMLDDDELEKQYLWSQLRRSQAVLYDLEQQAPLGEVTEYLQSQVEYQRRKIIELEDQLRDANRVLPLTKELIESAADRGTDTETLSFMRNQRRAIEEEYTGDRPNQHVVSAAISALLVVAERLGPGVVGPKLVNELASFAPSVAVKHSSVP